MDSVRGMTAAGSAVPWLCCGHPFLTPALVPHPLLACCVVCVCVCGSEALPQVLSLPLLGDRFVTAPWAQRAVAALTSLVAEHRRLGSADAETDTDTDTTTTSSSLAATTSVGADKDTKAARAAAATVRATLGSVLVAVRELLTQAPGAWGPLVLETTPNSASAAAGAGAGGVGGLLALLQVGGGHSHCIPFPHVPPLPRVLHGDLMHRGLPRPTPTTPSLFPTLVLKPVGRY